MTWYYAYEQDPSDVGARNAGGKARADICAILAGMGMQALDVPVIANRDQGGARAKLAAHHAMAGRWQEAVSRLGNGDGLIVQLPAVGHTLFFGRVIKALRRRRIPLVLLVHDLDTLRLALRQEASLGERTRIQREEATAFSYATATIVHNRHMAKAIHEALGYPMERMVSLELFDYLAPGFAPDERQMPERDTVVVAGNLTAQKAGYLYELPDDVRFDLFGLGLEEGRVGANVAYHGSFEADALPAQLGGRYGLVWDGPSAATCTDAYGEYLRINNPHKTSLYLASGLPVVVWDQAAIADVVRERGVGVCVASLDELAERLAAVSESEYRQMRERACHVGTELRDGAFTKRAVARAIDGVSRRG